MANGTAYDEILEVNYEFYIVENEIEMTFEDFRCEVDVKYRREHNQFPLWDDEMEDRLDDIADGIGNEFLSAAIQAAAELESGFQHAKLKEKFLGHVEVFLRCKSMAYEQEYPQTRRLKRKDIWSIQKVDFDSDEIFVEDGYMMLFEELVEQGYFKLVESGGDHKHDIFHVTEV